MFFLNLILLSFGLTTTFLQNLSSMIGLLMNNSSHHEEFTICMGEDKVVAPEGGVLACLGPPQSVHIAPLVRIDGYIPYNIWGYSDFIIVLHLGRVELGV